MKIKKGPHKGAPSLFIEYNHSFCFLPIRNSTKNDHFLIKKGHFIVIFDKNTPILPKIAKNGLKTNS